MIDRYITDPNFLVAVRVDQVEQQNQFFPWVIHKTNNVLKNRLPNSPSPQKTEKPPNFRHPLMGRGRKNRKKEKKTISTDRTIKNYRRKKASCFGQDGGFEEWGIGTRRRGVGD